MTSRACWLPLPSPWDGSFKDSRFPRERIWGWLEYGFDPLGNRLTKTQGTSTTTYGYTSQRLTSSTTDAQQPVAFGYDDNGNQTLDPIGTYEYTPANMLKMADRVPP
jgi:hypothetical protein